MPCVSTTSREVTERVDRWRTTRTRPVYGTFPDRECEPHDAFEKAWRTPYYLQHDRLTALRNVAGEARPESWAIELTRAYPALKARSERVHLTCPPECDRPTDRGSAWRVQRRMDGQP